MVETTQVSRCCGAVLIDMAQQHCVAVGDSASQQANQGGGPCFQKLEGVFQQ